jgi:type II secretory pathway component PulF
MVRKINEKIEKRKKLGLIGNFLLNRNKEYIIENLTLLADSGMGIWSALDSISEGTDSKIVKKVINNIKADVEAGSPLWEALEFSSLFPEKAISLIRIGERSGKLTDNLKVVSEQQQKERIFNSKIRGALMYPVFVLVIAVVVGVGIAWFILPKLAVVFSQLKVQLPLVTQIFIQIGIFLGNYGTIAVPFFIITFLLIIYFVFFFKYTKNIGQFLIFHLPIFKKIIVQMELARFGYLLGSLLKAGMPIVESIRAIKETAPFYNYRRFYAALESSVEEGNSFQKSFTSYKKINKLIPSPIQQMIVAAERSGHLSDSFLKIGEVFEERLDNTTKNLAVILEPVLLVIVWLGVMAVALAVILPIYGLIGGLR